MVRHKSIVFFPESIGILNIVVDIENIGDDMAATGGINVWPCTINGLRGAAKGLYNRVSLPPALKIPCFIKGHQPMMDR